MAQATAICTCRACGAEFTKYANKCNRREADAWEAWARNNYNLCPQCYAAEQDAQGAAEYARMAAKYDLPQIVGISEKQTDYAADLRRGFIAKFGIRLDSVDSFMAEIKDDIPAYAAKNGITETDVLRMALRNNGLLEAYACRYIADAQELIEILK